MTPRKDWGSQEQHLHRFDSRGPRLNKPSQGSGAALDGDAVLYRCRAGWCIDWLDSSKQSATINHINHRTGTTMQFLSKLLGLWAGKNSHDLPPGERIIEGASYESLTHRGEMVLAELQGMREDARAHAKEVLDRMEWFRAQMKSWDGNGMPATREEFDALCPSAAARENALRAQESAEGARAAAGLPCEGKDFSTGAPVFDEDHNLQIMGILGVNAKAGWVLVADLPMEMTEHGHIKSRRLRFKKIVQFDPNDQSSGSFHCYGRLPDGKEGV